MSITFTTYKGKNVFHIHPYYEGLSGDFSRELETTGSPFGYASVRSVQDYAPFRTTFTYFVNGRSNIKSIRDLFDNVKGRWGGLWFPSWLEDFKLTADVESYDVLLNVKKAEDFGTMYPVEYKTGWHVFIYVNNNEWYARRIAGYSGDTITLAQSLGKAYLKENIKFISLLYKGRFDYDTLEFTYITPTLAKFEMVFVETPYEYTTTSTTTSTTTTTTV